MKIETEQTAKDLEIYKEQIEQHKVNPVSHSVPDLHKCSQLVESSRIVFYYFSNLNTLICPKSERSCDCVVTFDPALS